MQRLKAALEQLDEMISALEDHVASAASVRQEAQKKQSELLKQSGVREANILAVAQKAASRLDHSIQHVEHLMRD